MALIKNSLIIPKPRIHKYPSFGKFKFSKTLKYDQEIHQKEAGLLILPGKTGVIDITKERQKNSIIINKAKLNKYFIELYSTGIPNLNHKVRILHTHIMNYKKGMQGKEKFVALPSITDIKDLVKTHFDLRHGYEIIGVFDSKKNECGYTVIKINTKKITPDCLKYINDLKPNSNYDKEILYSRLSRMGLEIYFTPMPGYKLDHNFNYIKEK